MGRFLGIAFALFLHGGILLFGGLLFLGGEESHASLQEVELLAQDEPGDDEKKEEEKEPDTQTPEELETEVEEAPDASEILRDLELSALQAQPELEAASLSAIADALNGLGAGDADFGAALTLASGGRIGGTGKPGEIDESLEGAFSLADIDQKPRAVYQATAMFPAAMRGKKVEGLVTVLFVVDAAGKVTEPRVEKATHPAFEKPALDAVRQWKFEPAVKGGQRVPCRMRVPIRFQPS